MPDLEKVIKGIDVCLDRFSCGADCPYYHNKTGCMEQLRSDAMALLKAQEAVKPGLAQTSDGIYASCGKCKTNLWKLLGLTFTVSPDDMPRFCPKCGQAVKWK